MKNTNDFTSTIVPANSDDDHKLSQRFQRLYQIKFPLVNKKEKNEVNNDIKEFFCVKLNKKKKKRNRNSEKEIIKNISEKCYFKKDSSSYLNSQMNSYKKYKKKNSLISEAEHFPRESVSNIYKSDHLNTIKNNGKVFFEFLKNENLNQNDSSNLIKDINITNNKNISSQNVIPKYKINEDDFEENNNEVMMKNFTNSKMKKPSNFKGNFNNLVKYHNLKLNSSISVEFDNLIKRKQIRKKGKIFLKRNSLPSQFKNTF